MGNRNRILSVSVFIYFVLITCFIQAQEEIQQEIYKEQQEEAQAQEAKTYASTLLSFHKRDVNTYDPLLPAKSTLYSAIIPGLGQFYQKKYWKIPIIYAAIGGSVAMLLENRKLFLDERAKFRASLNGTFEDPDGNSISQEDTARKQRLFREQQQSWALAAFGFYLLNILEANVSAHLINFSVNRNLSVRPHISIPSTTQMRTDFGQSSVSQMTTYGMNVSYRF